MKSTFANSALAILVLWTGAESSYCQEPVTVQPAAQEAVQDGLLKSLQGVVREEIAPFKGVVGEVD